ncbi:MAG: nitrile hydratase subunit beta [Alphaproteobacteria bacterium]|nr:nitrile hydratase subunit beta [Alphaproteobacteria bacterium]
MDEKETPYASGHHDYGGLPGGPIETRAHPTTLWEQRVDAMLELLGDPRRRLMRIDEFRWMNETMTPTDYERLSYYERWIHSITRLMIHKGIVTQAELDARMAELRRRRTTMS